MTGTPLVPVAILIPSVVSPDSKDIPPATLSILIASEAVPAVLVNDIFSLAPVPWGVNTNCVALFGPIVNVCPSTNAVPTLIEPDVDSTDIVVLASISNVPTLTSSVLEVVISTSLLFPIILTPLAPSSERAPVVVDHVDAPAPVRVSAPLVFVTLANSAPPSVPE